MLVISTALAGVAAAGGGQPSRRAVLRRKTESRGWAWSSYTSTGSCSASQAKLSMPMPVAKPTLGSTAETLKQKSSIGSTATGPASMSPAQLLCLAPYRSGSSGAAGCHQPRLPPYR